MSPRILVVDGVTDRVRAVRTSLESRGVRVDVVGDGEAALGAIETDRPDAILLEAEMAGMTGMEVLDRIRSSPQHASLPVILVGEHASDEEVLEGYKFGADYFLSPPISPRRLLHAIGLVLGKEFPE